MSLNVFFEIEFIVNKYAIDSKQSKNKYSLLF